MAPTPSSRSLDPRAGRRRLGCALLCLALLAWSCGGFQDAPQGLQGRGYPAAETLFQRDSNWLGGDAALSIPLDAERTLWLFGDSFIALTPARRRSEAAMVKNTIAVQRGRDPVTAAITFHWRRTGDGAPASFFPDDGGRWYWPGHGARLPAGPLFVFLFLMTLDPGSELGFACIGSAVAVIDQPDAPPDAWSPDIQPVAHPPFDALPATAVVREGDHLIALAIRQHGRHAGALVRYSLADLARGELRRAEWWAGTRRGWLPQSALGPAGPRFVLDDAGAEGSLHWDERAGSYLHVASYGFGASVIGLRRAPALTGPWSPPVLLYRPPEAAGRNPLVYAAKAHPELLGPTGADLLITYAVNSFRFADLVSAQGQSALYWPRFVALPIGR